jgi:modified peptide precursor CbpA
MVKETRNGYAERLVIPGFFMEPGADMKEDIMNKNERIIAYRRRCRKPENGTGLSHYILLTPKKPGKS